MKRLILFVTCGALLAACGSPGPGPASGQPSSSQPAAAATSSATAVKAINFAFQPQTLSVKVGTVVTFQNNDSATHTFTANDGTFDSGRIAPGQSFSFTFASAGSFAFHCQIHSSMTGTITVSS